MSCLYLPPPFFSSIFSFLSHLTVHPPSSILSSPIPHPPSSILSLPLSPIPYPLYPYPFLPPSIFNPYPPFPLLTPHSLLLTPHFFSHHHHPSPPPFPPSSFLLLLPLSHTHTTHATQYLYNLFFFIKEYGTFSIVCPATWFIKKVRMGLKGV